MQKNSRIYSIEFARLLSRNIYKPGAGYLSTETSFPPLIAADAQA